MSFDVLIKNGTIITAVDCYKGDIAVKNGKIATIGKNLDCEADKVIDANGNYVIPGGIDPHTHLDMPFGASFTADDFETGTKAAAFGGTTTLIDFAIQSRGHSPLEGLDQWHKKAEGKASIDYGFHMIISDLDGDFLKVLPKLADEGVTSYKLFMAYPGVLYVDDGVQYKAMRQAAKDGSVICMHAENGIVIDQIIAEAVASGKTEPLYHGLSRVARMEGEAVHRTLALAEVAEVPVYIVHLSSKEGLEEVNRARLRGVQAFAETCAQYLYLDLDNYKEPYFEGAKYVMSPPLRYKCNQELLWRGLALGSIQTVGSDHAPFNFKGQKEMGRDVFTKIPNGAPTVENRMALTYQGVVDGKITLNQFVEVTSTNAAKLFGLFPKKGAIAPGSDADLVIFNPNRKEYISVSNLNTHHMNVDYNPFEGIQVAGHPEIVLSRGEVIVKDNEFLGKTGRGKFLKRDRYSGLKPKKHINW